MCFFKMKRSIILTEGSDTVKPNLTVPSQNSDVRLVGQVKRRGFRKMAKTTCDSSSARPRRIKLNRNFNMHTTEKPAFHVKTLHEIKSEKEMKKQGAEPSSEVSVINNISSVAQSNASPMPARSVAVNASPGTDTRTFIKRENTKTLLLPTIKLMRLNSEHYTRSFNTQNRSPGLVNTPRIVKMERDTKPTTPVKKESPRQAVLTQTTQSSPSKKRKVSLTCPEQPTKAPKVSPLKKRKISPIRSPDSQPKPSPCIEKDPALPLSSPPLSLALDNPPSPALSLGLQSDDELDNEMETPLGNSKLVIMSEVENGKIDGNAVQKPKKKISHSYSKHDIHSRLGTPPNTFNKQIPRNAIPNQPGTPHQTLDDTLDVMSVIADDDELFLEDDKPNHKLKRTLSQDSIFGSTEESTNNQSNIRSLAKKTQANKKFSVGDLITSKPVPKDFRIPRQNPGQHTSVRSSGLMNNSDSFLNRSLIESSVKRPSESFLSASGRKGSDHRKDFFHGQSLSCLPPKPTRVVSNEGQPINGFLVQDKERSIKRKLSSKNINDAWIIIQELDEMKSTIDIRMLEETVKVCEQVSVKEATPRLAEIVLGVFEMLKHRRALQPYAYIYTILTLSRCGKFQEAFAKMSEMIERRTFQHQDLVRLVSDMLKCLRANPKWIIALLQSIKKLNFAKPADVLNNSLFSLANAPVEALREIAPSQWDELITIVCVPPNVQAAMQVQHIMDKNRIPMSDQATTKLLVLFRDTKSTKQLLDLAHLKCTSETFDIGPIFADDNLNLHDVEEHIDNLVKTGSLPREDVLYQFIEKAVSMKEFSLIYNVFQKCQSSCVRLSVKAMKKMVEALEDWHENVNAAIEVYTALRQEANKAVKSETKTTPHINLPQKTLANKSQNGPCFKFMKTDRCRYGDRCRFGNRCRFSHAVGENPQYSRQNSRTSSTSPQSVEENSGKLNAQNQSQADFSSSSTNSSLVNGVSHNAQQFPSFQHPAFVVPMFTPVIPNHVPPLRVPQAPRHSQPNLIRHQFPNQFQAKSVNPTARFGAHNLQPSVPHLHKPIPLNQPPPQNIPHPPMSQPVAELRRTTPSTEVVKLNRSFSWEPGNNSRTTLLQSPSTEFQKPSPGSDNNNNNGKPSPELQRAVTSKDWQDIYLRYVESKQASDRIVLASDLMMFQKVFTKDLSTAGSNFSEFVNFIHKEKSSVKTSYSDSATLDAFDRYDIEFIGSLGVSLMEKCLKANKFDKGYEILHSLHAHNISYFECGKNFGAYTRDIPPSAVAIKAVKLCMGVSQEDSLLGAIEVLRASNYAMPEEDISPVHMEWRIKILQQMFTQLFEQGNICEAYEVLQHLRASPNVMVELYEKVLIHYISVEDFDQSFDVLAEMKENGFDLNIPPCQSLYEKFLKLCLNNEQDDEALTALKEMEARGITLNGEVWQRILNHEVATSNEILTNQLFQRCVNLGVYPETFAKDTPWLCEIGCGHSRVEVKLLIVRHLKQLYQHLFSITPNNLSFFRVKDFQLALFPRISGSSVHRTFSGGIQTAMRKNNLIVAKVLQEDLNPPLTITDQTQEQFHSKFTVDATSLYRWFTANENDSTGEMDGNEDAASSNGSIESCVSYMTRMTEFD